MYRTLIGHPAILGAKKDGWEAHVKQYRVVISLLSRDNKLNSSRLFGRVLWYGSKSVCFLFEQLFKNDGNPIIWVFGVFFLGLLLLVVIIWFVGIISSLASDIIFRCKRMGILVQRGTYGIVIFRF